MNWDQFVQEELNKPSVFDDIDIRTLSDSSENLLSPIVKISISLLNRFLATGEKRLLIILPETETLPFIIQIAKILSDVFNDSESISYDPSVFIPKQKLKFQNYVVEYDGIQTEDSITRICLKTGDGVIYRIPESWAPPFQRVDTNRKLSKSSDISSAIAKYRTAHSNKTTQSINYHIVDVLKSSMTHFSDSVFSVSAINKTLDFLNATTINDIDLKKLLLVGKSDNDGNLKITGAGQLSGNPAFAYTSELASILEFVKQNTSIKMLFIDACNPSFIERQLYELDMLLGYNFPIICTASTSASFDLHFLEERGFFLWKWDKSTLQGTLAPTSSSIIGTLINNCVNKNITYIKCFSEEIDNSFLHLMSTKELAKDATANISLVHVDLLKVAFRCARQSKPFEWIERQQILGTLSNASTTIKSEEKYTAPSLINALDASIESLKSFILSKLAPPKTLKLQTFFTQQKSSGKHICLIIADNENCEQQHAFWQMFLVENNINIHLHVLHQDEYIFEKAKTFDICIVCAWFRHEKMKKIVYSYTSPETIIFIYGYEQKWKDGRVKYWSKKLLKSPNYQSTINLLFKESSNVNIPLPLEISREDPEEPLDELEEISFVIQQAQYKKYLADGGTKTFEDTTDVIPFSFVGNCIAFYKPSHKVIDVTEIVFEEKSKIKVIDASELNVGNFIVIRESEREIIRELADIILKESNYSEKRALSRKWRETIEVEAIFSSSSDICKKIQSAGCNKSLPTIRHWLKDESIIIPRDKMNLLYIAKAMEDQVLEEKFEEVYEAGRIVQQAHLKAGQILSKKLQQQVAKKVSELSLDPYNIWDPIDLYLDDIGKIKILKIIDKGSLMRINSTEANHIIEEF